MVGCKWLKCGSTKVWYGIGSKVRSGAGGVRNSEWAEIASGAIKSVAGEKKVWNILLSMLPPVTIGGRMDKVQARFIKSQNQQPHVTLDQRCL